MRLDSVSFKNFRCFRDERIDFSRITTIVGENNCGKSTILKAIDLFFSGKSIKISENDFYIGCKAVDEMKIRLDFAEVEGKAAEDLSHYVRSGRVAFEIAAKRSEDGAIDQRCVGIRYGLEEFKPFFEANNATDKRRVYDALKEKYQLPKWTNVNEAIASVNAAEADHVDEHVAIPSSVPAYGATGPLPTLQRYFDWIYVPAVKDVSDEAIESRNSAFSKLALYAIRSRSSLASEIEAIRDTARTSLATALENLSGDLEGLQRDINEEFRQINSTDVSVGLEWHDGGRLDLKEPILQSIFKDGRVFGTPDQFGHGLQRTYLMALLSLAGRVGEHDDDFKLLIGVEEPELYQHPPQARYLSRALADIADANSQVILSTHSNYFIGGRSYDGVRVIRKRENASRVYQWSADEQASYYAKRRGGEAIGEKAMLSGLDRTLQTEIAEIFFAPKIILVEGIEDRAILEAYLEKRAKFRAYLKAGCHIVPVSGKTKMPPVISLCRGFGIDVFCLFDLDRDKKEKDRNNNLIVRFAEDADEEISLEGEDHHRGSYFWAWSENIQAAIRSDVKDWDRYVEEKATAWGWSKSGMSKDPMVLSDVIAEFEGEIPCLSDLIDALERFWNA
ncbi:ATP-dependent nuclease [Notoacmeibacter ruber]|uniref:DUF2813 domain-containing protein n=1 Tax=Notoacmeibacter ruber TaxID=2670375 RepID=A0A3L7JER9_9HYPH|nr:ATP-dependent endonuclease [Notoacmeibacter ruber]RLQ86972.1 DUF2813 domain-containing protein [Notoacmeibacter ruber]